MSWFIFSLTLKQVITRKSTLIPVGLSLLPILVAVVFRLSAPDVNIEQWAAKTLFTRLIVTALLPLTVLLLSSSVIGDEMEDGTAVYLLTKPIARWRILLPKLLAPMLVAVVLTLISTVVSGYIALQGQAPLELVRGFALGVTAGAVAYMTVFTLISLTTSRALIAGLVYVFLWEALVTSIFKGTRYVSIRQYTLGIADWFSETTPAVFNANLGGMLALILFAVTTVLALFFAFDRLRKIEVREAI